MGLDGETRRSVNGGAWERHVRIVRHELTTARDDVEFSGAGRLLLNVRDGVRLDVVVERTAPTKWGYSLSGRVAGGDVGFVTLVVHDEAVAGTIWTPQSAYELHHLGRGVHALRDVTNTPPLECGGGSPSALHRPTSADATEQAGVDDGSMVSVVDILVIWTQAGEDEAGGESQMLSRIELHIAYTNDAFERSGAFVSLNLVGAEKVDYIEVGLGADLSRLLDPDDDHMDGVHDRRNALGADLVYFEGSMGDGRAVPVFGFAGGEGVGAFPHEVGHLFFVGHDRSEPGIGPALYENGFTASCDRTIMSYEDRGPCDDYALPSYASPWRYTPIGGEPLGVTRFSRERGALGPADAVLAINRARHTVAAYRPSRNGR